jgi:hypothetical protein
LTLFQINLEFFPLLFALGRTGGSPLLTMPPGSAHMLLSLRRIPINSMMASPSRSTRISEVTGQRRHLQTKKKTGKQKNKKQKKGKQGREREKERREEREQGER